MITSMISFIKHKDTFSINRHLHTSTIVLLSTTLFIIVTTSLFRSFIDGSIGDSPFISKAV